MTDRRAGRGGSRPVPRPRGQADQRLGSESPLSATWRPATWERAVLVAISPSADDEVLDELAALARAAGAEPVGRVVQARVTPDPATYVGRGKVGDVHDLVHATSADAVIFDDELTPGQLRTLEQRFGTKVLDRTALILDIFALHARSGEGKAQVELAQLNYLLPRLRGWGEAMSRLGGGIGTRGPGESKLEMDRQHIRRRIARLRKEIVRLGATRAVQRAGRERSGTPAVALAGYTNAGKSTLMNALTGAGTLVADQPFATVDPTTRRLPLPEGRRATVSDTVGFVRKLPHELIAAFRSTLEEVARADVILHVADASVHDLDDQVRAVREVLHEIGAIGVPEVLALNKWDLVDDVGRRLVRRRFPDGVPISALSGEGSEAIRERLSATLAAVSDARELTLLVPFDRPELVAWLHRESEVSRSASAEGGTRIVARVPRRHLEAVSGFVVAGSSRRSAEA